VTINLTDERIIELAHRKASRYYHNDGGAGRIFAFSPDHLLDLCRAIVAEAWPDCSQSHPRETETGPATWSIMPEGKPHEF
jgi:hypothetical protein